MLPRMSNAAQALTRDELLAWSAAYRDGLLEDTVPFWTRHAVDRECGGFLTYLDADGSVVGTDKPLWVAGRFSWLLARLYNTVEPRAEWLDLARHGIEFLRRHGFDRDGRMFYSVTRDGRPLRKRRYLFSETFAIIALSEYARAAGEDRALREAGELFRLVLRYHTTPGLLEPKTLPATRRLKSHAMPMILVATTQVLRRHDPDPLYARVADECIREILRDFVKPELKALLENVPPDGGFLDEPVGREVNPGHAIETAWFLLEEARARQDARLRDEACRILDWSLDLGWDREFGGLYYFRDVKGMPCAQYEHDMKLWWPQCEAVIAALMAYASTGDERWARWFETIADYAFRHFRDDEGPEWFGYLHKDNTRQLPIVKGNYFKGPLHLPRMLMTCDALIGELLAKE